MLIGLPLQLFVLVLPMLEFIAVSSSKNFHFISMRIDQDVVGSLQLNDLGIGGFETVRLFFDCSSGFGNPRFGLLQLSLELLFALFRGFQILQQLGDICSQ